MNYRLAVRIVTLIALLSAGLLAAPERYSGRGLVLAVDRSANVITISHEKIPGLMDAMVMRFNVRKGELLQGIERGHRVYFRLAVEKNESYLDHILLISAAPVDPSKW